MKNFKNFIIFTLACIIVWLCSLIAYFAEESQENGWVVEKKFAHMCELNKDFVITQCLREQKNMDTASCVTGIELFEFDCNTDFNKVELQPYLNNKMVQRYWLFIYVGLVVLAIINFKMLQDRYSEDEEEIDVEKNTKSLTDPLLR